MADGVSLTRRELDIMSVLWRRGSATVAEVRDDLADDLAYPTVQTMLRVLEGKAPHQPATTRWPGTVVPAP